MWGFYMTEIEERNIKLLLDNIDYDKLSFGRKLLNFHFSSERLLSKLLFKYKCVDGIYSFKYKNKIYEYKKLSDTSLIPLIARNELKNNKGTAGESVPRILRLASNGKLNDPKLLICYDTEFLMLVSFNYSGQEYIIDYYNDLIMNRDDYFSLSNIRIINEVSFRNIYDMYDIIKEYDFFISFLYFLLFPDDIVSVLNKYTLITDGDYSKDGINLGNFAVMGNNCDDIFLINKDKRRNPDIIEIEDYTVGLVENDHIKNCGENHQFKDEYKEFTFMLYSDIALDDELKSTLCSDGRYHKCHISAWKYVSAIIKAFSNAKVSIVGGKYLINDVDYYYHSWIELELEGRSFVIDYTKNLIIERDRYYQLTGAVLINRVEEEDINNIIKHVKDGNIKLNPMYYSYFAKEILSDLERNKHVLKR